MSFGLYSVCVCSIDSIVGKFYLFIYFFVCYVYTLLCFDSLSVVRENVYLFATFSACFVLNTVTDLLCNRNVALHKNRNDGKGPSLLTL